MLATWIALAPQTAGPLSSPEAALVTLAAGALLLAVECLRPGRVVPGALGLLLVLLSVYRLCFAPLHRPAVLLSAVAFAVLAVSLFPPLRWIAGVAGACLLALAGALVSGIPSSPERLLLHLLPGATLGAVLAVLLPAAALARRNKRSAPAATGALQWRPTPPE